MASSTYYKRQMNEIESIRRSIDWIYTTTYNKQLEVCIGYHTEAFKGIRSLNDSCEAIRYLKEDKDKASDDTYIHTCDTNLKYEYEERKRQYQNAKAEERKKLQQFLSTLRV